MSNLPVFGAYAAAFEQTLLDDNWSRLEQYFTPDATYLPGDGSVASGRDAVFQALKDSLNSLDRKADSRELMSEPEVSESGDTVTLKFALKYTRSGLPDLSLLGVETIDFVDGAIHRMEDVFDDQPAMAAWIESLNS